MEYPHVISIPYGNPALDFASFASLSGSFFLDSSQTDFKEGRYSFWGIKPLACFKSQEGFVSVNRHTTIHSPPAALKELYQKIEGLPYDPYFPFCGGLVGYFGYEWGSRLENIAPAGNPEDLLPPDAWFGLFDTIVGYDHLEKSCRIISLGLDKRYQPYPEQARERAENMALKIKKVRKHPPPKPQTNAIPKEPDNLRSAFDRENYFKAIQKIKQYLKAGDCYQVNLTQRFLAPARLSSWKQYLRLRKISPAPYSTFLNCGKFQILSSSPELFLEAGPDGMLKTKPIKGTRSRGETPKEDQQLKTELEKSDKDKAELLMITDLLRNDLGRVCRPGSVRVPKLQSLESFAQVHHLVSTVVGERRRDCDILDCLTAMLPGGSVTGAPKIRAMEIIRELEPVRRGVYTGSIGWIGPANTCQMNIAIRTMVIREATAAFHAGGGIVIDSDPQAEYEESLTKVKGILEALGL